MVGRAWQQLASAVSDYRTLKGLTGDTFPLLFLERCRRDHDKVAFRAKKLGIYREVTFGEYLSQVERLTLGLVDLGLKKGDRVAVMGGSFPEWCYAELGAQCAGAVTYGIYFSCSAPEVKHHLLDGGAKFFIAENQEFVDKVLPTIDELPDLRYIVVVDTTVMFMYKDARIVSMAKVQDIGAKVKERNPQLFEERISQIRPDDLCTIFYTSGTTGMPKGVMHTQQSALAGLLSIGKYLDVAQRSVSYMPLAHGIGRMWDIYFPILVGYCPHFGESSHTMQETLFDVSPHLFMGAPRTYEKLAGQVLVGIETSSWIKKVAYRAAMAVGRRYVSRRWQGKVPFHWVILYRLAYWSVFRHILDKLGLARVKYAIVAAAPVPPEVVTLWQIWGLDLREEYGLSEGQTPTWPMHNSFPKPGTASEPTRGTEIRISERGELLLRGSQNFLGYWHNEVATAEALRDGWLHTTDAGRITEDGEVKVNGRITDVQITAGGKNITPEEIEKAIKASPYISEVIVFANGRKFPSALIELDFDTVSEWARDKGVLYTTLTDLTTSPGIHELIAGEIAKGNELLAQVERVKKFRIIPKELDPEDEVDPLTANRKIQRQRMYERYRDLVESMYEDEKGKIAAELGELRGEIR